MYLFFTHGRSFFASIRCARLYLIFSRYAVPIACSCDKTKNISLFLSDYNLWQAKHTLNVLYSQGPSSFVTVVMQNKRILSSLYQSLLMNRLSLLDLQVLSTAILLITGFTVLISLCDSTTVLIDPKFFDILWTTTHQQWPPLSSIWMIFATVPLSIVLFYYY